MSIFSKWKELNTAWELIEPFVINLIKKEVPKRIVRLYENLAKFTQPAINSLIKLKEKTKETPSELDDYCFTQGVDALETFANYLLEQVKNLRS